MNSKDIAIALRLSHLFSKFSDEELELVKRHSHVKELREGEALFFQGDDATNFYFIVSGRIKLYRMSADGKEKVVEIMEPGSSFAEALMFLDQPHYPVSAAAIASSCVISINCYDFKAMLRESIETCFLMLGSMSLRLRALLSDIDTLSLDTGTVRTAAYLLSQAPKDADNFELKAAKSDIASRLSVKPETFSRILKSLQDKQIITIHGRKIIIHDRDAMITMCSTQA